MEAFTGALGAVAGVMAFVLLLAVINERFVEKLLKPLLSKIGGMDYVAQVALVTGALISILFGIDVFTPIAEALGISMVVPWAGIALTAVLVGGGSNFIHDVWPVPSSIIDISFEDETAMEGR